MDAAAARWRNAKVRDAEERKRAAEEAERRVKEEHRAKEQAEERRTPGRRGRTAC